MTLAQEMSRTHLPLSQPPRVGPPPTPLQLADPEDACSPFSFTDYTTPWIALIARQQQPHANNCTFDVKVGPLVFFSMKSVAVEAWSAPIYLMSH